MSRDIDVAIVGGGAAGLTAAHFLARAGLSVEIYDQDRSILKRARLHNLPGVAELEGRELLASLRAKCADAGVTTVADKISDIAPGERFTVTAGDGSTVSARYVVLATGQGTVKLTPLARTVVFICLLLSIVIGGRG